MPLSTEISTRQISRSNLAFEITQGKRPNPLNVKVSDNKYYTAGEDILENDAVYLAVDGKIYKASYLDNPAIAFAKFDALSGANLLLNLIGEIVILGFSLGDSLYLNNGTPNYSNSVPVVLPGDIIQELGFFLNDNLFKINIDKPIIIE